MSLEFRKYKEELNHRNFSSKQEVHLSCFEYIEGLYNTPRLHGTLNMLTPNEKEEKYFENL
ncbi:IS3 family transposase [Listeria immobilis]|uniref:IS3 family transposase n=1 Tax=Listeria immobilis TaxID=2713502 RepID=UPI0035E19AA1